MFPRIRFLPFFGVWVLAILIVRPATAQTVSTDTTPRDASASPSVDSRSAAEPAPGGVTRAFDRYVLQGGWVTIFTLIPLSVAALALMIQYLMQIRRPMIVPEGLIHELRGLVDAGQYAEALQLTHQNPSTVSEVLHAGFLAAREGVAAMERAMEDALEERAGRFQRKIEHLNLIGSVAPMIGLFGTVNGIIGMFSSISEAGGVPVMSRISHDLGSALVATFWGLFIAIPALTVFGILRNRIEVLMQECAVAAESLTARFRVSGANAPESVAEAAPAPKSPSRTRAPAPSRAEV